MRSGLRHPRQLTARVIASETFSTVTYVLLAARAVQRRRPRVAAGRRQRSLAAWASAAGAGLVAWGLGTEAPTRAEMIKNTR